MDFVEGPKHSLWFGRFLELWGKWEDEVKRWGVVGPGAVSRPAVGGGARDPTLHSVLRSSSSRVGQFCGRDISDISDVHAI